jgi:hypothetical protein
MKKFYATITPNPSALRSFGYHRRSFENWAESILIQLPAYWEHYIDHTHDIYGESTLKLRSEDEGMHSHLRLLLEDVTFIWHPLKVPVWFQKCDDIGIVNDLPFPIAI